MNYWTTREGNKIRIIDMDDKHLLNTMHMLVRNAIARHNIFDTNPVITEHYYPIYKYIEYEAKRRKLLTIE